MKKEYQCGHCFKTFLDYPSQRRGQKAFCSLTCKHQWNKTLTGHWKGKKMSDSSREKMSRNHADVSGKNNPRWKGGKRVDKTGYILVLMPEHPFSDYHGYVREHRLVIEKEIGRVLKPEEVVHHINHDKQDNRPENLRLLNNAAEHQRLHWAEKKSAPDS